MKAVVVESPFNIRISDVPAPKIENPDEVLIKVKCGGICGSDIGIYKGTNSLASYPRIIGHEFGGFVEAVGSKVKNLKVGDLVAVDPVRPCGHCYACTHDRYNVCNDLEVIGVHRDGGFAEYAVAPEKNVYKLDPNKVPAELSCLVEPYSIGVQVNCRAEITADDKVLIMGSGPIGCSIMQVAKSRGAWVMMTDIEDKRLEKAKDMGADLVVNVKHEDLEKIVMENTNNEGIPVVADSVCSLESLPRAMELACPAGRVICLGLRSEPSQIPMVNFTKKELDVRGSRVNKGRFPEVIELFEKGLVTPAKMRTHTFPFEKITDALDFLKEHPEDVCKITLVF
ncbi:MAG: zinc-binding alcohol dehydrogenase family protein [Oscillospiraceae bacterium]